MKKILAAFAAVVMLAAAAPAFAQSAPPLDPENTLLLTLDNACQVTIQMRPDLAPNHVERIKTLVRQSFYDGQIFHRVIDGFMAQTGDPTGTGMGGSPLPNIAAEFNDAAFTRGAVGMARAADPNSANSQFFITFAAAPWLNGQYTLWGYVVDGMDCVDAIPRGEPPANPGHIVTAQIGADVH